MQFIDLGAQHRKIRKSVDRAIKKTIARGQFILGENVAKLEAAIARFAGTTYAVGVNSGTDALLLSLRALGVGKNDEVITTPFSFVATAETIAQLDARPVFVDIDPRTYNIDPLRIERAVTKRTKAIIPVHLYGQMADMAAIMHIARKRKLLVVEDAAQALGAKQKHDGRWRMAGSIGDIGCFSFFPTKNLGAYGDGGMVATNDRKLSEKIRLLRNHGSQKKYYHEFLGYSSRLDELQAAILLSKFPFLRRWNASRQRLARRYAHTLGRTAGITVPFVMRGGTHVFHQYTIRATERDTLRNHLEKRGVPTSVHYPLPLHLQPAFRYLKYKRGSFPEAERASREVLSLPIYPELTRRDQEKVTRSIQKFFSSHP